MSDVSEDALYEALGKAREMAEEPVRPVGKGEDLIEDAVAYAEWQVRWQNWKRHGQTSRALLEAARWFREHEEHGDNWFCPECNGAPEHHHVTCTVGRWVRAAERAGL